MSSIQTSSPRPKKARTQRKKSSRRSFPPYGGMTLEISAKIFANIIIATVAVTALNKLILNYKTQLSRLEEVKQEVQETSMRVEELNNDFTRHFDPYQSEIIMQQHTNQIKPNQRHIIWLKPNQ